MNKKGDKTKCENYKEISYLNSAYSVCEDSITVRRRKPLKISVWITIGKVNDRADINYSL